MKNVGPLLICVVVFAVFAVTVAILTTGCPLSRAAQATSSDEELAPPAEQVIDLIYAGDAPPKQRVYDAVAANIPEGKATPEFFVEQLRRVVDAAIANHQQAQVREELKRQYVALIRQQQEEIKTLKEKLDLPSKAPSIDKESTK